MQLLQIRLVAVAIYGWTLLVSGHAARRGEPNRDPFGGLNSTQVNNATNTSDPTAPPISFSSGFINASSISSSAVSFSSAAPSNFLTTSALPSASASESDPTATIISVSSDSTSTNNSTVTAIAASVGASIAASLVVFGGVLFCIRTRPPRSSSSKSKQSTSTLETETTALAWRLTSLETEATALRERVARLEARGRRSREGAVVYADEKDDGMGAGRAKDCPPTYVD
ncbi:hypothetical protein R3P38DRAFT_330057 [Favolaschia claudopus]|uniref:Uncharacterized protein n=1 Tax=Favolaschia claudopus TaxID=2862362 RepID=A0AAV9ZM35_9AGAR